VEWTVLVPVKPLGSAKSRLRGALPGVPHRDLVLAIVLDTVSAALAHAAAAAGGGALAALAGDLPALRGSDLAAALSAATTRGYAPDRAGTGTTLLATPPGVPLEPRFGPGSARAHARSGAVELPAAAGLRLDVDTPADLVAAARLGLGPRTAILRRLDLRSAQNPHDKS
jgi:2-phospho-L-lactate guanylyltransferase